MQEKATDHLNELKNESIEERVVNSRKLENLITILSAHAQNLKDKLHIILNPPDNYVMAGSEKKMRDFICEIKADFEKSIFKEGAQSLDSMFADLFSQTIAYLAFSKWIMYCKLGKPVSNLNISLVSQYLPTGSFLKEVLFKFSQNIPESLADDVDKIFGLFRNADLKFDSNYETLISTSYSTFLQKYDPTTAKDRGVVYTPYEIVNYMVQGIDAILIQDFKIEGGIINTRKEQNIQILDPAAGTMAFGSGYLRYAFQKIFQLQNGDRNRAIEVFKKWFFSEFVENMYAFEILIAPYVLGYIHIFFTLEELGLTLTDELNLNSYLTNAFMTSPRQETLDMWLKDKNIEQEPRTVSKVKDKEQILIVMGNPPYSLTSQNNSRWIQNLLESYKEGLNEGNLKILSDDYVKFIRFGQWRIEQTGQGILAYISNNKYLDGQVYHVMRASLRKSFDKIYIVNLRGDIRKREKGNPFDISVGVTIAFMVKNNPSNQQKAKDTSKLKAKEASGLESTKLADVYYMDVPEDKKEEKFLRLSKFDFSDFVLLPETKKHYFVPIDTEHMDRYESFIPINKLYKRDPISGVMVGRDKLLTDIDEEQLAEKIGLFFDRDFDTLREKRIEIKDTKSWSVEEVFQKTTRENVLNSFRIMRYGGFDFRYVAYDKGIVEGHRSEVMSQVSPDNLILCVSKSSRLPKFDDAMISDVLVEKTFMCNRNTAYAFIFDFDNEPNLTVPHFNFNVTRHELLSYIYSILYSDIYRERYNEFLLKEFPRIPFTKNEELFRTMAELGSKLIDVHLFRIPISPTFSLHNGSSNSTMVGSIVFSESENRVYLNMPKKKADTDDLAYIAGVSLPVWNFTIGMVPQIQKFLTSRKGFALSQFDIEYLLKLCSAIQETLNLKKEIDIVYDQIDVIEDLG